MLAHRVPTWQGLGAFFRGRAARRRKHLREERGAVEIAAAIQLNVFQPRNRPSVSAS